MAIRVLIADDHEVVRVGLRSMLNGADVTVVADASSGAETLAAVEQLRRFIVHKCPPSQIELSARMKHHALTPVPPAP